MEDVFAGAAWTRSTVEEGFADAAETCSIVETDFAGIKKEPFLKESGRVSPGEPSFGKNQV